MNRLSPTKSGIGAVCLLIPLLLALPGCGSTKQAPVSAPAKVAPAGSGDPQKDILAQAAKRNEAMVQVDLKTLGEILRDDLTYIHSSGPIEGKVQVLDEISTGKLRYRSLEPSQVGVRVYGETGVVTGRTLLKVSSQHKEMAFSVRFTEVWVRTNGVWQLASWQATRIPEA